MTASSISVLKIKPAGIWMRFIGALIVCLLASCAGLIGPRQVELPLSQLQAGLDRRFPVNHRILEIFEIHLSRPQLVILPEPDRIALTIDVSVARPLGKQPWNGSLEMSGQLFADAARGAILIRDIRVNRFALDGLDEFHQQRITKAASLVTENIIKDLPLYSFRPEDLYRAGVQFVPSNVTTTSTALVLTLTPVK